MKFSYKGRTKIFKIKLQKDLSRDIKRGHPWVYKNALERSLPNKSGFAQLLDKKGKFLASGTYEVESPLSFRVLSLDDRKIDNVWVEQKISQLIKRKAEMFDPTTTGYRLVNGEGDGLSGLICDIFGDTAVLQTDGQTLHQVWDLKMLADLILQKMNLKTVVHKPQRGKGDAKVLKGAQVESPVKFLENSMVFTADVLLGQKTGFFLDQRNTRDLIKSLSSGKDVLNLFSYTGGFSVAAGCGGAKSVCSVDLSEPAIEASKAHWALNDLHKTNHRGVAQDVFQFCEDDSNKYDIVIADPPSFAPNKGSVEKAEQSYIHIFSEAARKVKSQGFLALASCSSHIDFNKFDNIVVQSLSKARRRGRVLSIQGQPEDHCFPLVCPELRYLKFYLLQLF